MILAFFFFGMLITYDPSLFFFTLLGIFVYVSLFLEGDRCERSEF